MNNSLTEEQEYLLVYGMEECGEVIQASSKIWRFGPDSTRKKSTLTNREELEMELGDLFCIAERLISTGLISKEKIEEHSFKKHRKLNEWEESQREKA